MFNKTEAELKAMSDDELFAYLDAKSAYLKKDTKPLSPYHIKRSAFATAAEAYKTKGTDEIYKDVDYDNIKKINVIEFDTSQSI